MWERKKRKEDEEERRVTRNEMKKEKQEPKYMARELEKYVSPKVVWYDM